MIPDLSEKQTDQEKGQEYFADLLRNWIMEPYLPGVRRMYENDVAASDGNIWLKGLLAEYPVMLYSMTADEETEKVTESDYARLLMLEGTDEDRKSIGEEALEYGEDAMHLEQSLADALLAENGMYIENQAAQQNAQEETEQAALGFSPVQEKVYRYQWEELNDYEAVVKAFYAVDSTTKADAGLLNVDAFLAKDMRLNNNSGEGAQILIYHTHAQEAFADSVPGDVSTGIVGAGEYLAELLREEYGYRVMHHTDSYDEDRDYAYSNSLPAIEELLADNPSIEVVIDLHRDAMPEERRLVTDIQGRPTAQFMFFNGLSRTAKGEITYLENPYLQDNLAFSFQMQAVCNEYYPGVARRIYLKAYRYNMHVCPKTLLIELGAQNNTREEIWNACDVLAHVLDLVLSGKEPQR